MKASGLPEPRASSKSSPKPPIIHKHTNVLVGYTLCLGLDMGFVSKNSNHSPPPLFGGLTAGLSGLGSRSVGPKVSSKYRKRADALWRVAPEPSGST